MPVERRSWRESFSEWFHDVLFKAELVDYRYPVKGCGVWLPYGFKLRSRILALMRRLLDESGHEEVLFPLLITEGMLAKESEHVESFSQQVFWVTRAGGEELAEKLALRPTSETAIAPMLQLWIRSHTDLPKRIYQIVSVFRYETKATRPLIRVREITTFKEAHTCHETFEEAEEQVKAALKIYSSFFDQLAVPYIISKRPEWDKFAGALYSLAYDTVFPDGRTLQIGTIHNLGQSFSKAFEITFETRDGGREHVWQTCYGISERVVAAVIALHGDDHGLVLPPTVAPIQAVIIPIPYKGYEEKVNEKAKALEEALKREGFAVHADLREKYTPGSKFYDWELRGVPVRIEVGPRDVEKGVVTLVRRDTLERKIVPEGELPQALTQLLNEIQESLRARATRWLKESLKRLGSLEEAKKLLQEGKPFGVLELPWCGRESCGMRLEEELGLKALGTPYPEEKPAEASCASCGGKAETFLRLSRQY
ncbi:proline--tRNA ligase [Candidatus Bathyarchaeota archaeon]|nr:MAG: proline--tRNA ligase [Candidatus Bathyarchaeota archaeon]